MSIVRAFDLFRHAIKAENEKPEGIECYVPESLYKRLMFEIRGIQRLPSEGGFDLGIILFEQIRVKPLLYLESMRYELEEMQGLKRENIRLRCALAGDGSND